jgi:SAM-dependent methyltransferase
MASTYTAGSAEIYEQLMGRWSRRLAPEFLRFADLVSPRQLLDVGCGTGSLAFAAAEAFPGVRVLGVDAAPAYIAHARSRASDARLAFEVADAMALPAPNQHFDAVLSLLVLNFVPDGAEAAREMVRVAATGGVVAACVWDFGGGFTYLRMLLDTAAATDPDAEATRAKLFGGPLTGEGELADLWVRLGLHDVQQAPLAMRMKFRDFADFWQPYAAGQGSIGPYIAGLDEVQRAELERRVARAYCAGRPDGPRSFAATAWAVRGVR